MNSKTLRVALCASLLAAFAMCAVPTLASASKKSERRQNRAIKRTATAVSKANKAIKALSDSSKGIDGRLKTIEDAAPAIISGLTQLKDAATALKTGLEAAGAGLTSLKTLATSQEYGIGQLIVLEPAPNPQEGSFVETPDIPDAVQQAQTEQQFIAQNTGNLAVSYGIRSAESDGTGASDPAGYCKVTVTNAAGTTQTTAANATFGGLPFQPVDNKSALTSTDPLNAGFPFGLKTNGADADQTTTYVSTVPVTAGQTYTVGLSCLDTSPSTTDPSA
jgi:hypothetical protein